MTVAELRAALAKMPNDRVVVVECPYAGGYCATSGKVSRVFLRQRGDAWARNDEKPAVIIRANEEEG